MPSHLLRVLPLALCAFAHVQMLSPIPRNTADRNLPPWAGGKFGNYSCNPHNNHRGCWGGDCHNGTEICDVGQNFLWFNQGEWA